MPREITSLDRLLIDAQNALETVFGRPAPTRANPAGRTADVVLDDDERRHAAGLMRINHVGEVCAQALYCRPGRGRARPGDPRRTCSPPRRRKPTTWPGAPSACANSTAAPACSTRCGTPAATRSASLAGLRGDGWNLGFVVETERQVEAHLRRTPADACPPPTLRSRAILQTMKADEARHADACRQAQGARVLPQPVPTVMAVASNLMKAIAYRI